MCFIYVNYELFAAYLDDEEEIISLCVVSKLMFTRMFHLKIINVLMKEALSIYIFDPSPAWNCYRRISRLYISGRRTTTTYIKRP